MKELVEYIVKNLVIDKDSVNATEEDDGGVKIIHVFVAPDDMGRVIGRSGKIASAVRAIINSISSRQHQKVVVKFGE